MLALLAVGVTALSYPFVSDAVSDFFDQQIIRYYQSKADRENEAAIRKQQQIEAEKNEKLALAGNDPGMTKFTKAVNQKKKSVPEKTYLQKHIIAVLDIPKIHVSLPVFDQTNALFLQKGVSLLEGTSYPIGGKSTHAVISGHRGIAKAKLFTDLPKLKKGDEFYLEIGKDKHAYKVDRIDTIEPTDTHDLVIQPGKDLVTLMTCTPYMINSQRLLVTGHRVPYHKAADKKIRQESFWHRYRLLLWLLGAVILLGLLALSIYKWQKKQKRKRKRRRRHRPV